MKILRQVEDLRAVVADWHRAGEKVGVVPTMGALHDGHLSLVRAAGSATDRVIVTIFVNPAQFNNPEEWELYSEMISSLVDFLVAVGKRKKDFRLVKSKLFSFSCCQ